MNSLKTGNFLEELFYRINVIDVTLPPLRERRSDVPLLINHFLKYFSEKYNKRNLRLSNETEELLSLYHYPGNIRELKNIIERVVILAREAIIKTCYLPQSVFKKAQSKKIKKNIASFKEGKRIAVAKFEREYITEHLRASRGNVTVAARDAGICITHFYKKLKEYDIDPYQFKRLRK